MRLLSGQNLPSKADQAAKSAQAFVFTGKEFSFDSVVNAFDGAVAVLILVAQAETQGGFVYE